jgi:high-affinity K+ transport system ATPase subunit B
MMRSAGQADVGVAMNTGTVAARSGAQVDLDQIRPLIEIARSASSR